VEEKAGQAVMWLLIWAVVVMFLAYWLGYSDGSADERRKTLERLNQFR
jgi:type VI protein secretion system component VasF